MSEKITIQGYEGSFHQEAARQFFGKQTTVLPCGTFREVVQKTLHDKEVKAGVMAIENSIAGSILPNYNLLHKNKIHIIGEVYLHIRQNLLVNPGVKLEDIREVHSHTMALQQCYEYLDKYNWKLVETEDTALSARLIHEKKSKTVAAIASKLSAELFDLDVIAPNIHTLKNNYTRFLIIEKESKATQIAGADKASVYFHTDNSKGSLAKVLNKIAAADVNLSKLQSFPIPGTDFLYSFHADMEFDALDNFYQTIEAIRPYTEELHVYGVYKNGRNNKKV